MIVVWETKILKKLQITLILHLGLTEPGEICNSSFHYRLLRPQSKKYLNYSKENATSW